MVYDIVLPTLVDFWLLVGGIPTPLKNMTSSVGMMIIPNIWKNRIHVPNHQPEYIFPKYLIAEMPKQRVSRMLKLNTCAGDQPTQRNPNETTIYNRMYQRVPFHQ
jgi:hypothetical protein